MALGQDTRNRLQRFVNDARKLLTDEFTRQLQQDYGMDPQSGAVSELASLTHLDDSRLETAQLLRDIQAHYLGAAQGGTAKKAQQDVLLRMTREQAFTVLNRLVAVRMMEVRGLLQESIAQGYQSKGFELYARLAGPAMGDSGNTYRCFLFSVFDEFVGELPQLFDRSSPQGRLFPRDTVLLDLLALINDQKLESLWAEDETIGWIYQYYNSKEERKEMRKSAAPRNSRELAVRNQFFTPRYAVEFLVDNSLGRAWFDWTGGQTALLDRCQYLLRKPDDAPELYERTLRDPRSIKLLDPACGSMHFGLYAFDLFEFMYSEAWDWEQANGPGSLTSDQNFRPLQEIYSDQGALLLDVPRLIIEQNIYGVDIDARATQIASLALWLRAQRSWHDAAVKSKDRPIIGRGHVIAAVAPPAEPDLREQMASNLDTNDAKLFEETLKLLKGLPELGVLLKMELEIPQLIHAIYGDSGELFAEENVERWQQAESRLRGALEGFINAAQSTYQGRLFAQDALEGLRLMDLGRETFDVVVMNPPFGQATKSQNKYYKDTYPETGGEELAATFFSRAISLLRKDGFVAALSSRTFFYLHSFASWRRDILFAQAPLNVFCDIGAGELDGAVNETAIYVGRKGGEPTDSCCFAMLHRAQDKGLTLQGLARGENSVRTHTRPFSDFASLEDHPLCYWVSSSFMHQLQSLKSLGKGSASVQMGLAPRDEFRYSRLWWEIDWSLEDAEAKWKHYAKGGELSPYFSDVDLVLNAHSDLREVKADLNNKYPYLKGNLDWVLHPENSYFEEGLTFGQRTTFLRVSVLPKGCYFSVAGKAIFGLAQSNDALLQAINTPTTQYLISLRRERLEMDPQFQEGIVARMPWPEFSMDELQTLSELGARSAQLVAKVTSFDETSHYFAGVIDPSAYDSVAEEARRVIECGELQADKIMAEKLALAEFDHQFITNEILPKWSARSVANWYKFSPGCDEVSYAIGVVFGRWDIQHCVNHPGALPEINVFDEIPKMPAGMRETSVELRRRSGRSEADGSLNVVETGVIEECGLENGLVSRVDEVLQMLWGDEETTQLLAVLKVSDLKEYLTPSKGFFSHHLQRYSRTGRRAPIYWPLSTETGAYVLWVYYPKLTSQTIYSAVNELIEPRLAEATTQLNDLRRKGSSLTAPDQRRLKNTEVLFEELFEFRSALLEVAPQYQPSLEDGVQITAAPLWPFFRHKPWQKILKETWEKLEAGEYDWAHLAYSYWPDRVREKCKTDKSLAIAHGQEELYEEPTA